MREAPYADFLPKSSAQQVVIDHASIERKQATMQRLPCGTVFLHFLIMFRVLFTI